MTDFNPDAAIQSIVSIRNLVTQTHGGWDQMLAHGEKIDTALSAADSLVEESATQPERVAWRTTLREVRVASQALRHILNTVHTQLEARNSTGIASLWADHAVHTNAITDAYDRLQADGLQTLASNRRGKWAELWRDIRESHHALQSLAQATGTKLAMIEAFTPAEVSTLSDTILRHIPRDYSPDKAATYEAEYRQAVAELEQESKQTKNLWDRFLDLLAGGVEQTPAERVMLQRWLDGERDGI